MKQYSQKSKKSILHSSFFILHFFFLASAVSAQELNCRIQVNSDKIAGTNREVFDELGNKLTEFVNSRKWTDAVFLNEEQIECNLIFTISEMSGNHFSGDLQVQSSRPVFNSSYTTTLFNFKDPNIQFDYSQFDRLEFYENSFSSNLTSLVAYYINVILGLNFDSYSRYGGTKYFDRAASIVALAQSSDDAGWKAFQSERNRYALISNYQDESLKRLRDVNYEYHRLGLDEMSLNVAKGRDKIYSILPYLRDMNRAKPYSIAIILFAEAKRDELLNMFSNSTPKEKREVYEILKGILPTDSRLDELLRQ
ncbi:MAG: DUF4835 family protein [Prevotellaceae bacterium]|jgi:hypothetical protein|nr:DUF4835 family protein [Prevotellaceae bacterium]